MMTPNFFFKLTILLFVLTITSLKVNAQLSNSYYDDNSVWQISAIYAKAENTWDQKAFDRYVTMYSVDLSFYKSNFKTGGFQRSYRLKLVSDFIPQLASPLFKETRNQLFSRSGLPVLTSLMGWYNFGWAVIPTKHFQLSVGGHLGGYTHGIEVETEDDDIGDTYPFIAAGPAVFLDVDLPLGLEIHYEGSYAYTYLLDADKTLSDGEEPQFLNQNLQIRKNRWFLSLELVNGLVNTGNSIQRSQIGIGYGF